jgi:RimJ/RimL family protein N-acetyltransferase
MRETTDDVPEQPVLNIVGEKVALGPLRRDLVPLYQQWINDFSTLRTLFIPPVPITLEQEFAWFDRATTDIDIHFTIYERATLPEGLPRPIGNALWRHVDFRNRTAEMAIFIGDLADRGKGYGTEATRLMLDYAFTALGLHNCMLTTYAYNLAGYHAYRKAGFREIGRRTECHWFAGRLWDEIYMECLATGFESPVLRHIFTPDAPRS